MSGVHRAEAKSTSKLYAAKLPSSICRRSYRTIGMLVCHYRTGQAPTYSSLAGFLVHRSIILLCSLLTFQKGYALVYHNCICRTGAIMKQIDGEYAIYIMSETNTADLDVGPAPLTRDFTATTFVVYEERTLLLLHRKLGQWFPPGGHIDPHELPDQAAIREVREESGLEVELLARGDMLGRVRVLPQPYCILLEDISSNHQHIDLIYFARVCGGSLAHAEREAHAARWFTWEALGDPEIAEDIRILGRLAIESYR